MRPLMRASLRPLRMGIPLPPGHTGDTGGAARRHRAQRATCHGVCADKFLTSLAHTSTLQVAGLGLLALYCLLAIAAVLAVSARVRAVNDGWVRWTSTLAIIGLALNAIDALRAAALFPAKASAYVQGDAAVKAALTVPGALWSSDPQGWFKFGAFGFWVLVVSVLALRGIS